MAGQCPLVPPGVDELWGQVQMELDRIQKEVCRNLIESMPRRMQAMVKMGWEPLIEKVSNSSTALFTGLLRMTMGLPFPDKPSEGPTISAVIWVLSIGQVPVFLNDFLMFSRVKAQQNGLLIALRKSSLLILLALN